MISTRSKPHRGTLVICVLVCLLVASTMVTATTHSALRSRRSVRLEHQMRQTELLLDAGVLRAARQLHASDDYRGETWRPANAITRFDNALVDIRVTKSDDDPSIRSVEVVASLGTAVDDVQRNKASLTRRTHTFDWKASESSPTSQPPSAE